MGRYALIVGVGEYRHLPKLSKPRGDAKAVCDRLRPHFDEVHLLQDAEVTYERLLERLEYVLLRQGDRAEVLLYFTGHGFTAGQSARSQQGYLATYDCEIEQDIDGNILYAQRALPFQELNTLIGEATPAKLAMLLDCCHSEFFIEQSLVGSGLSKFGDRTYFLSAACRSYEKAWADTDAAHSVYTGALLEALKDRSMEEITASEAHNAVQRRLRGSGQEPIPIGYGQSLVLVRHRQAMAKSEVSEVCPYQGLNAFTPETEAVFFGRAAETQQLVQKLERSNFVMVLGPSGSGKSSVVRAGLVTRLRAQGWQEITMKPDAAPTAILKMELRKLLRAQGVTAGEIKALLSGCSIDSVQPAEEIGTQTLSAVEGWLHQVDLRLLLVVDQFEEVFTLCDEVEQQQFVSELLTVRDTAASRLAVVATMRSDFVNEWLAVGYPAAVVERDVTWLSALKGENLRDAILKPAQARGYDFGEGLLDLLLENVAAEYNCLPLLEFALTELWEKRDTTAKKLTASAYREMGGLKGALDKRAETVYNSLREVDKPWAKRVCLRLVRLGKGEKDTRQRQTKTALLAMGGAVDTQNEQQQQTREIVNDVIVSLVAGRLLVSDGEFVDLAHEALLDGWERYAQWRQADRDLRRLVQRIEDEYEGWKRAKESDVREENDYLLKGGLLAEAREQRAALSKEIGESRSALMKYFADSDRKDEETVAVLKQALADADMRAESLKVRDKLLNNPSQTVDAALSAVALVGKSQEAFQGEVTYPAQDALHRAWSTIRERLKLVVYSSPICSVALNPQGNKIVSGSDDGTLRLWDLSGNLLRSPFHTNQKTILSVAFSPDGNLIVSGGEDNTLRMWDLSGNPVNKPFLGHTSWIYSIAFTQQGDRILSGSDDFTIRIWDLEGNSIGDPLIVESSVVTALAANPLENFVASIHMNNVCIWNLDDISICKPYTRVDGLFRSVAFSPKGNLIVLGGKGIHLYNLDGKPVGEPFFLEGYVESISFSPEGNYILTGGSDGTVRLWDIEGKAVGKPLFGHSGSVESVTFSPEGDSFISMDSDGTVRLWKADDFYNDKTFHAHNGSVYVVAFNNEGDRLVSGGYDGELRLWDLSGRFVGSPLSNTNAEIHPHMDAISAREFFSLKDDSYSFPFSEHSGRVLSTTFSPTQNLIVSGGKDHLLRLWTLQGDPIGQPFSGHSHYVYSVAFSPDGDLLISGSGDRTLRLWDLKGNTIGSPFEGHNGPVRSVAFSPQGNCIVSGSADGTLRLWDLAGSGIVAPLKGHIGKVRSVAFSPTGDRIVSSSDDHTLRLWDLLGNPVGSPFEGHSGPVRSVAFSPQGDRIVSGSHDKTLRLWDLSGNPIGEPFSGHSAPVYSVAFSPQGDRIVSGSSDGTLRLWRVGTWEDELRYCCNLLMCHPALAFPQNAVAENACKVCQQVWTRQQSAAFAVAQGSAIARTGDIEEAIEKFNRAKELDPTLSLEPVKRANELAEWSRAR